MTSLRTVDPEKDKDALLRIWKEVGWLEKGKEDMLDTILEMEGGKYLAEVKGSPECNVNTSEGSLFYQDAELPLHIINSVITSPVARRQGLAAKLTAKAIAEDAVNGAYLSALGIFDQGFYNQLGFGTGSYENWIFFDPSTIITEKKHRVPDRISSEHWKQVHRARLNRRKVHGLVNLHQEKDTKLEMHWPSHNLGLGYFDDNGEITHHVYFRTENLDQGPYTVQWMTYQNREQFMELMSILRSLSDQVNLIIMREPPGIQFQDMLARPFRHRRMTRSSKFENKMSASAYWQMRIIDLEGCIKSSSYRTNKQIHFNLLLHDPIEDLLDNTSDWRGLSGDYRIKLGKESSIGKVRRRKLPTLKASVNAFTRLWLGVRPATSLAMTDELSGPTSLLEDLDDVLRLPTPHPDWDI